MAHILIMPRQGNTVESCIITDWKVKEGDTVTQETTVCEVETDKASFEVPAGAAGTVLKLLYKSGDDVPVLKPIAVIGASGENWEETISGNRESGSKAQQIAVEERQQTPIPGSQPSFLTPNSPLPISPRARNLAEKEKVTVTFSGSGPGGRVIERDVMAALQNRPALTAAAKAAGQGTVPAAGSGLGGRVTAADMASNAAAGRQPSFPAPHFPPPDTFTETPIKGIRKIIADRMFKSLAESAQFTINMSAPVSAQFTINMSAPASKLLSFRAAVKAQKGLAEELALSEITINDLILFAAARTLPRFPFMNAHKIGDTIRTFERLHLAVAVDTPRGLMVPVIRNADLLSLAQISSEAKRLAAACQNGAANPDELTGSTFTVSNLGNLGVTSFTPVINAPEVAILGVCAIEMKPAAPTAGNPLPTNFEPHIGFSLTINHQAVDGAPAARFLKALCDAVANIDLLLAANNTAVLPVR